MQDAPRIPSPELAACIRSQFIEAGYTNQGLAKRFRRPNLIRLPIRRRGRKYGTELEDAGGVLVRLFLDEERVDAAVCHALLPHELFSALKECGILVEEAGEVLAAAALYPCFNLWIASDRGNSPDGTALQLQKDAVYPALSPGSHRLAELLPSTPCASFLEACGGTGAIALQAATSGAARACSSDILERCSHFARFNAALNGIGNFEAATGDLYDATPGVLFDRIVAHPPYVPRKEVELVYRDGGADGEYIIGRLFQDLPRALAPGGRLYMLTYASDRNDASLEQRIRQWLGQHSDDFDVALFEELTVAPEVAVGQPDIEETADERLNVLRAAGVVQLFYGLIVVQRRDTASRDVFTIRTDNLDAITSSGLDRFLNIAAVTSAKGFDDLLLHARLTLVDGVELHFRRSVQEGALTGPSAFLAVEKPLPQKARVPLWVAQLLGEIDGQATTLDLHEKLRRNGNIPEDFALRDFNQSVVQLLWLGALTVPGLIPPPAEG